MERHFDQELKGLKDRILYMGSIVEGMIHAAVKVLMDRDLGPTQEIFKQEEDVNQLHIELDDRCLKLIALHQPTAQDLRFITAAMKINSDLERMGDQAVNVAENVQELMKEKQEIPAPVQLRHMTEVVKEMLRASLDAFVRRDAVLAQSIIKQDDRVDAYKQQIFDALLAVMRKKPKAAKQAMDFILIARNLERLGDHATNVAEDVVFMVLGKDIRHYAGAPSPPPPESLRRPGAEVATKAEPSTEPQTAV